MKDCFFKELKDEMLKMKKSDGIHLNTIYKKINQLTESFNFLSQRQDTLYEGLLNTQKQVEELLEYSYESNEECEEECDEDVAYSNQEMIDHINRVIDLCGFSGKIKAIDVEE